MKKGILFTTLGVILVVSIVYVSYGGATVINALHDASHKVGLCNGAHAATLAGVDQNSSASCMSNPACTPSNATATLAKFSEQERKLIDYVCDRVVGEGQTNFDDVDFEQEIGVSVDGMEPQTLQVGVMAELNRRNFNFSGLAGASYCSKFSACSVDRDLSGATGEELARYKLEKAQDGNTFIDRVAPDFTLPTTDGKTVSLSDYRGRLAAVVFLSGHCSHSFDTLPILAELRKKYGSDVSILPVYVNSGTVDNVLTWSSEMNLGYPLVVSESKDISKAYDTRMVPSTFLIDREGRITKKYVGYKDKSILDHAFAELVNVRS